VFRDGRGTPHAHDAAARRAWDRSVPASAPALSTGEPRNSVLTSRVRDADAAGGGIELQLTYTSGSGYVFTDANLRAVLAAEERVRAWAGFEDVCARDWVTTTASAPASNNANATAATALPPCRATDTALRACAGTAGCEAGDIAAVPAGILKVEGALDVAYAEQRLQAYAQAINNLGGGAGGGTASSGGSSNNNTSSSSAAAAAREFQKFVGVGFGRRGAAAGDMLATRFSFATPLPGYASSADRAEEQERKVYAFAAAAGVAAVKAAGEASSDLTVGFACVGGEGGDGCRAIRERDAAWWAFVAGGAGALGATVLASAAHQAPLAFTTSPREALARAAITCLHALTCAAAAAGLYRATQRTTVDPLTGTLAGLAVLRFALTDALAMASALGKVESTAFAGTMGNPLENLPQHGSLQWHVAAKGQALALVRTWWSRSFWAAAAAVLGCATSGLYSPVSAAAGVALAVGAAALAAPLASWTLLAPVLVAVFRRRLDPARRRAEIERYEARRRRREGKARKVQEELAARREQLTWAAAVAELAAIEFSNTPSTGGGDGANANTGGGDEGGGGGRGGGGGDDSAPHPHQHHPKLVDEHDWSVVYLQKEYWQGPGGVRNTMEGTAGMDQVGRWGTPVVPSSAGDAGGGGGGGSGRLAELDASKAGPAPAAAQLQPLDEEQGLRGTEDDVEVLALPAPPPPISPPAAPSSPAVESPPKRMAGYVNGVWTVQLSPPPSTSGSPGPGPVTESRITAAGGGGAGYVGDPGGIFDDDEAEPSTDPWAGSKYARDRDAQAAEARAAVELRVSQMQMELPYGGLPGMHAMYAPPWDNSGMLMAARKSNALQPSASSAPAPFKIRQWDDIDGDDGDGGHGYGGGGQMVVEDVPGEGDLASYGLDRPEFAPEMSPTSSAEDSMIRAIERLDPDVRHHPPSPPLAPPKPQPAAAAAAAAARPKPPGSVGGLMKGKWKAAVAKVMSGDDVRAEWARLREQETKDRAVKKGPGDIASLREATMALLKREREKSIPAPPPPEAIERGRESAKAFSAAVQAEIRAEARLAEAEDLAEDNAVDFRDAGEAAAESYGRLVARFRWGTVALGLAAAAGVCYLCYAGPAVAAAVQPPSALPASDFAVVFHDAAALGAGPLTLTNRGGAVRVRLAFGVDPEGNGELISNRTSARVGAGGGGAGAAGAVGRVSVGAACAAAACDGGDALAATAAGGGGNATATSCWMRDVRAYVNALSAASATVRDDCGGGAAALGAWEDITGCPAACDCRPPGGGNATSQARSAGGAGCAAAVEVQERAFWRAVRAYAASSGDDVRFLLRPAAVHASSSPVQSCAGAAADAALAAAGHVAAAEIHLASTWHTLDRAAALSLADTWRTFWSNLWLPHPIDLGEYEDIVTAGGVTLRVEKRAPGRVLRARDGNVSECAAVAGVYGGVQYAPAHPAWTWRGASGWAWVDWARRGVWDVGVPSVAAVGAATLLPVSAMTRSAGLTAAAVLAGAAALALAAASGVFGLDHGSGRGGKGGGGGGDAAPGDGEISLPALASLLAAPAVAAPWLVHLAASYLEAVRFEQAEAMMGKRKRYRTLPWSLRARRRDRMRCRCTCAMLRDAGLVVAHSAAAAVAAAGAVAAAVPSGTFIGQIAVHQLAAVAGAALACLLVFPALTAVVGPTFEPPTRPRSPIEVVGTNMWKGQRPVVVGGGGGGGGGSDAESEDADAVTPFATPNKKTRTGRSGRVVEEDVEHILSPREKWMQKKLDAKERAKQAKQREAKFAPMAVMEGFEGDGDVATAV
jgi:hypothetical protein